MSMARDVFSIASRSALIAVSPREGTATEPFDLFKRCRAMPKQASEPASPESAHPRDDEEKAPIVEVVAEGGDQIDPPPPEIVEPDPELTPEDAEQARKDYLLTRFWFSARGYWGPTGD